MEEKEKLLIENSNNTIVYKYLHMFLITSVVQVWLKVTLQHQSRMESTDVLTICQISQSQMKLWFWNPFAKLRQVWLHLLIAVKHQYELPMEWSAIAALYYLKC